MRSLTFLVIPPIVALLGATARPADACSFAAPYLHEVDPSLADKVPPSPPVVEDVQITRGRSPGYYGATSCDDSGVIAIVFRPGNDDIDAPEELGFRLELIAGTLPDGLVLPSVALRPAGTTLVFPWIDGATDDQESFSATVAITAIDRAGNHSAPATIVIADQGSGCNVCPTGSRAGNGVGLILAGLALVQARRRVWP